jgi:hypothetical protein
MVEKYNYSTDDKLININTLSPCGKNFYRISKIKSLNPSAWGVKIAFLDIKNKLIFYQKNIFAHQLRDKKYDDYYFDNDYDYKLPTVEDSDSLEFVRWSENGCISYILEWEYKNIASTYTHKFIDLKNKKLYIKEVIDNEKFNVPHNFKMDFFKSTILTFESKSIINDKFQKKYLFNKWFPLVV